MESIVNPKVSVIIPVYGVEPFIERCARSLFEQTMNDIEYIFIDDCTRDRSIDILMHVIEEYQPRLTRDRKYVRIEKMPTNSGLPAVRRYGVPLASGEYIIHSDSDDWCDKNMLYSMYSKAKRENADCVVCDFVRTDGIGNDTRSIACHNMEKETFIDNLIFQRDSWSLCNKLFKKTCYKDIQYPVRGMGEDMALCIQLVLNCDKISYVQEPFYYYYYNPTSISHKKGKLFYETKYEDFINNLSIVKAVFSKRGTKLSTRQLNYLNLVCIRHLYPLIRDKQSRSALFKKYTLPAAFVFFDKNVTIKDKFIYVLSLLGKMF